MERFARSYKKFKIPQISPIHRGPVEMKKRWDEEERFASETPCERTCTRQHGWEASQRGFVYQEVRNEVLQMDKKIGMIGGTGPQGQGLALRWGLAGEPIIMGSRQQEKADRISAEVNKRIGQDLVTPRTNEKCVEEADIILLTVPFEYAEATLKPLLPLMSEKKIVVDVTVPLKPFEKGKMVDVLPDDQIGAPSATELFQKLAPEIPVIGAFKTLSNFTLDAIDEIPTLDQDVFILGKNKEAKRIVTEKAALIKNLRPVNAGSYKSARHVERFTAFVIGLNRRYKTHHAGMQITGLPTKEW